MIKINKQELQAEAGTHAKLWILTNYPNLPHFADDYRTMYLAYTKSYVANYIRTLKKQSSFN